MSGAPDVSKLPTTLTDTRKLESTFGRLTDESEVDLRCTSWLTNHTSVHGSAVRLPQQPVTIVIPDLPPSSVGFFSYGCRCIMEVSVHTYF